MHRVGRCLTYIRKNHEKSNALCERNSIKNNRIQININARKLEHFYANMRPVLAVFFCMANLWLSVASCQWHSSPPFCQLRHVHFQPTQEQIT